MSSYPGPSRLFRVSTSDEYKLILLRLLSILAVSILYSGPLNISVIINLYTSFRKLYKRIVISWCIIANDVGYTENTFGQSSMLLA